MKSWLLFRRRDIDLISHIAVAGDRGSFRGNIGLFIFGPHWALEGDFAVLRDDLDVVGVGGQRLVLMNGRANFLGDFAIGRV